MIELDELKKLKKLLDSGIINEIEFKSEKSKLLGLDVIKEVQEEKDNVNKELFQQEKMKAKAILEAKEELKQQKILEKKEKRRIKKKEYYNSIKNVFFWILSFILWLLAIGSFGNFKADNIAYLLNGIIMLIQGCLSCPIITKITQKNKKYTKVKKYIIIVTIIMFVAICSVFPTK